MLAARLFRVCTHTILNWETNADPDAETVGNTVQQTPPITRLADIVRNTVRLLARFGSDEMAALVLTRAGWKVSERTVHRVRKERPRQRPTRLQVMDRTRSLIPSSRAS